MRILEATGTDAVELLGDIMMPFAELASDKEIATCLQTNQIYKGVMFACKKKPKAVLEFLAACDTGVPVDQYKPTALEIPKKLMECLNNPIVQELFTSPAETVETFTGSVTANTEDPETM